MPGRTLQYIGLPGSRVSPTRMKGLKMLGDPETLPTQSNMAEQWTYFLLSHSGVWKPCRHSLKGKS